MRSTILSMQAYFTASVVGKKYHLNNYHKIIDILKSKNINVKADHILDANETNIRMEKKEERLAFQAELEKWINSCDFMVVETSFPSISVGYEISLAIHRGKPVLILYSEGDPPSLLAHNADEKLVCEKYTVDTLKDIIDDFLNFVESSNDMRFTFFITSAIAAYLDEVSRKQKVPKSVYLRRLIEEDIRKKK
jgi:hypothetical protein